MYYAHSLPNDPTESQWHKLADHLQATSDLAAKFAAEFGAHNAARLSGLLHDLGKYSEKFQRRIKGSGEPVDHATAGAIEVTKLGAKNFDGVMRQLIAYAIAGHHAGLADFDELTRRLDKEIEAIDPQWREDIALVVDRLWPEGIKFAKDGLGFALGFLGRMLFSCLVDADFKDTEAFYAAHGQHVIDRDWPQLENEITELIIRFDAYMTALAPPSNQASDINKLRSDILSHVRAQANLPKGLFTLTVPTGGGKTLASLGFALDHAKACGLRRIIYAIPFTSIIDQTVAIFREVLGADYVLEHHSSIDEDKNREREELSKLRLAMEDWAAPVIVTTNVQLFESLFANRPSKCRKLHNLANSVIILDEAQTLPLKLLRPTLAALNELARNYGCTIVLCTATQPALDKRDFESGLDLEGRELAPAPTELAQKLRRVTFSHRAEMDDDQLVAALREHPQSLVIVNSRKHALNLYRSAVGDGLDGVVHLTTRQYAAHRKQVLAQVRTGLKEGRPCRLIATSLIEAGVDVDFPRVWRAVAGLDQVLQAAGRCNREGNRRVQDSIVTVFKPADHKPPREFEQLISALQRTLSKHKDLLSPDAIRHYFREVYWQKGSEQLDEKFILGQFGMTGPRLTFNFRKVAEDYRMIESVMLPVIINDNPAVTEILNRLQSPGASAGKAARELQPYVVQVPHKEREALIANGSVVLHRDDLWGDQFAVLNESRSRLYTPEAGLIWEEGGILYDIIM